VTARDTMILFDANAAKNQGVQAARRALAKELVGRGARVRIAELPVEVSVNGPDDYIAKHGDTALFDLIEAAESAEEPKSVRLEGLDANDRDLPKVTAAAWGALVAANNPPRLFRHGDLAVRLELDEQGAPVLTPLTRERLRHEMARAMPWFVWEKRRPQSCGSSTDCR
jgi:DNA primase